MRLYERFADKNFHTSVATTFGIDFDAYKSIALSRLRGAGCRNNLVIADSRMLTHALGGASDLPQRAGTHYTISGASAPGVFHPKLFLQLGRKAGRMIVPRGWTAQVSLFDPAGAFLCSNWFGLRYPSAECRGGVVEALDEVWQVGRDALEGLVFGDIDCLDLEGLHEALGLGVVVGVSAPAHSSRQDGTPGAPA